MVTVTLANPAAEDATVALWVDQDSVSGRHPDSSRSHRWRSIASDSAGAATDDVRTDCPIGPDGGECAGDDSVAVASVITDRANDSETSAPVDREGWPGPGAATDNTDVLVSLRSDPITMPRNC